MRKVIYLTIFSLISGCSPFGNESIISSVGSAIEEIFQGKASSEIVSGATQVVETNPGVPSQNYKVSVSVGGQFSQTAVETNSGYEVYTSVQSSITQ